MKTTSLVSFLLCSARRQYIFRWLGVDTNNTACHILGFYQCLDSLHHLELGERPQRSEAPGANPHHDQAGHCDDVRAVLDN